MKKLLLALALLLAPSGAWAQCSGVFTNNTVCGNATGSNNTPRMQASTLFPAGPLVVGSTVITGGTNLRVLYDNLGILGEYTNAQLTALINLATTSLSGALPAWPNNTTTFFRGDGTYATLNCAALTNGAASCSTDTTNATNISTGTLAAARLPAFGSGDVSFATAGGTGTIAANVVTNAKAAQAGANTVKGNFTAGTANVADNTVPSCPDSGGNHLNYIVASGLTCGTTSAGTAVVLLNTLTASSSATLSDLTSFTSSFNSYDIVFTNILPATNATSCEIQVHTGGVYKTTGYGATGYRVSGSSVVIDPTTTFIPCFEATGAQNSGAGISGKITVYNPAGTTSAKVWVGIVGANNGTLYEPYSIAGIWTTGVGAIDGFQVLFSAGNIASGTIKIYGVL